MTKKKKQLSTIATSMDRAVRRSALLAELEQIDLAIAAERGEPDPLDRIRAELKGLFPDAEWYRFDEFKQVTGAFTDFELNFKESGSLVTGSLTVYEISAGFALSVPDALLILAKKLREASDRITRQITPNPIKENHGTK